MSKSFKDMTLDERIEHAHTQARQWRGILRQLNRELTAITSEEREALRTQAIEAAEIISLPVQPGLSEPQQ